MSPAGDVARETSSANRQWVIDEIRRTARDNGGRPLGRDRFFKQTGIKPGDWEGRYWARWGDALREAGFAPNSLNAAMPEEDLLRSVAELTRKFGRLPTKAEVMLERRSDPSVPWFSVMTRRLGTTNAQRAARTLDYCEQHPGFDDVAGICRQVLSAEAPAPSPKQSVLPTGAVYLFKSGRYYKIGRTNAAGRRERELALLMPDKGSTVHAITTDDPTGIEAYWHTRFASKRKGGEWFDLDAADVQAFKRRKFM